MNSYRPMKRNTIINKCLKNGEPVHHYIISKNIGRGGSGFTYLAQDETGKPCVIKEYIPFNNRYSFVRNSNDVLVFNSTVSESQKKTITNKLIQIAAHEYDINHKAMITEAGDNSPYIFDFTTFSDTSSDVIYGLIQTVEGEVFSEYITHITTEEKIHLLLKVSDAIKYINSRGILHADLTPENIYVNSMGQVQILDFGASMDIGKFRRGTTEDKKKFARNLLSTNVGSFSRYYCSENLLTFANSINFVSNDNESDINKIVDILSNNISYADDIYSFKQIILFTLIGAPEAKIYLSSMTVEEYICDRLKDDFNITINHLLCKLVHTNEFDLNILTDFLKLIDYYRLQGDPHVLSNIMPDFSLSNSHNINNSLKAMDHELNSFLLDCMIELPSKIKMLFGAPYWLIKDLLTELLINFLSDNPKPSYRDNLFLDGILSSLHNDVLTKTLEDNNITIFQKIISYLKSANCIWLTTTFTEYFKTLIINNLNTWDNAIYSYDLAILRDIYLIECLFNEKDFDNITSSIYDVKYHNKHY